MEVEAKYEERLVDKLALKKTWVPRPESWGAGIREAHLMRGKERVNEKQERDMAHG